MTVFAIMLISVNKLIEKVDLNKEKTKTGQIKTQKGMTVNGVF